MPTQGDWISVPVDVVMTWPLSFSARCALSARACSMQSVASVGASTGFRIPSGAHFVK